jgi:TRAP-type uncharacterized transport system fused permease subunit
MAIPTTAKYIMVAMMVAPALVLMDIPGIAAHLFIFYFAILSDLTPPVALTAMAAAGVARSDFYKTSFTAVKLALAGFIVPYLFVYSPKLLLGFSPFDFGTVMAIILAIISIYFLGAAMINWAFFSMNISQRIMTFVGAILLISAKLQLGTIGILLISSAYYLNYRQYKSMGKKVV